MDATKGVILPLNEDEATWLLRHVGCEPAGSEPSGTIFRKLHALLHPEAPR